MSAHDGRATPADPRVTSAAPATHAELVHDDTLDFTGTTIRRAAVRGVLQRDDRLLLVRSNDGDYAFPGGGIEPGETPAEALAREFLEECGVTPVRVGAQVGTIVEHRPAREADVAVFTMTSHYYRCFSEAAFGAQRLEGYEIELGLTPVWVGLDEALRANDAACADGDAKHWVVRETLALRLLEPELRRFGVASGPG